MSNGAEVEAKATQLEDSVEGGPARGVVAEGSFGDGTPEGGCVG